MPYKIEIPDPVEFINNVAFLYQSAPRIFMEYVDNSFDDAEMLYLSNNNHYPYPIEIDIFVDPVQRKLTFIDNCRGMDKPTLLRIISKIGQSNKKGQPWTNGQFGFGIQSFRACAEKMCVISKTKEMRMPLKIEIDRQKNEAPDEKEVSVSEFPHNSGTKVVLSDFDKDWWLEVNIESIKNEIENHFEGLLTRANLEVRLHQAQEKKKCCSLDYRRLSGKGIDKEVTGIGIDADKSSKITFGLPIKIYLKVTDQILPNKRPIFLNKGRRIEEIKNIKSFMNKSKYRTSLWGHSNLTGYIEVNDNIEPTIERNEFKKNKLRQLIYDSLVELEDSINDVLKEKYRASEEASLKKLEDILSTALSKLAKFDLLKFRTVSIKGSDIHLKSGGGGEFSENASGGPSGDTGGGGGTGGSGEGEGAGVIPGNGLYPEKGSGTGPRPEETDDNTGFSGSMRKKSGFNVKISDLDPPEIEGTSKKLRSQYLDGSIYIYKNHPDFLARMTITMQGDPKLNQRLIMYLASEISVHYKNVFYERKKLQPDVQKILNSREELFKSQIEFIYEFENLLQPLVNVNLLTLEVLESQDGK